MIPGEQEEGLTFSLHHTDDDPFFVNSMFFCPEIIVNQLEGRTILCSMYYTVLFSAFLTGYTYILTGTT